jgi:hypothetical protein
MVEVHQRFKGTFCLHHHGNDATAQKPVIFILAAVEASNPLKGNFYYTNE